MPKFDGAGVAEWRLWDVPAAAALGYSIGVIPRLLARRLHGPLQNAFGWTRAEASLGLTIVGMAAAVAALPIGLMVDRMGPRRVGSSAWR